ncbi:uncharacterized protein METZ01_LOCUS447839, partial [marine metagenome]
MARPFGLFVDSGQFASSTSSQSDERRRRGVLSLCLLL